MSLSGAGVWRGEIIVPIYAPDGFADEAGDERRAGSLEQGESRAAASRASRAATARLSINMRRGEFERGRKSK